MYATTSDLEARWRPLTPAERDTADTLLGDAEAQLRSELPDLDARAAADAGVARNVTRVVCAMVRRAMAVDEDAAGVATVQESAGPFSRSFNYSNPMGDLYLTKAERRLLGTGRLVAGSIDTAGTPTNLWDVLP